MFSPKHNFFNHTGSLTGSLNTVKSKSTSQGHETVLFFFFRSSCTTMPSSLMVKKLSLMASKHRGKQHMNQHKSFYINIIPLITNQGISKFAVQTCTVAKQTIIKLSRFIYSRSLNNVSLQCERRGKKTNSRPFLCVSTRVFSGYAHFLPHPKDVQVR